MLRYIVLGLVFVSCNYARKQETMRNSDEYESHVIVKDTIIIYGIEGISAEGAEAKVQYVEDKIASATISIYGETGQASVAYKFKQAKIEVLEIQYSYKSGIENVKSNKDMKLERKLTYFIDFEGNFIGDSMPNRIDIFQKFKEEVPFHLEMQN
jgi:hypothetical protein